MMAANIPGDIYDSWTAFLPPQEANVQRLVLEREDTKQKFSLSFIKGSAGEFEQNLCVVMQDGAWPRACEKVLRVWTEGLQSFALKATPLAETLERNQGKVLSFVEVRNYTAALATMVRFMNIWNSRKGILEAVSTTRSPLAQTQFIAPLKASICAVQALFDKYTNPLLSLGLKLETIEYYANELLKRPQGAISQDEITWVKETKNYIDRIKHLLSADQFFNQRTYAYSAIDKLCSVITHVGNIP